MEYEGNAAYRSGSWKLIGKNFESTDGVPAHAWELYDLTNDSTESNDVADDHPKRVYELAECWMDWTEHNDVTVPEDVTIPFKNE